MWIMTFQNDKCALLKKLKYWLKERQGWMPLLQIRRKIWLTPGFFLFLIVHNDNLHNFAKALEERPQISFSDITGQTSKENFREATTAFGFLKCPRVARLWIDLEKDKSRWERKVDIKLGKKRVYGGTGRSKYLPFVHRVDGVRFAIRVPRWRGRWRWQSRSPGFVRTRCFSWPRSLWPRRSDWSTVAGFPESSPMIVRQRIIFWKYKRLN